MLCVALKSCVVILSEDFGVVVWVIAVAGTAPLQRYNLLPVSPLTYTDVTSTPPWPSDTSISRCPGRARGLHRSLADSCRSSSGQGWRPLGWTKVPPRRRPAPASVLCSCARSAVPPCMTGLEICGKISVWTRGLSG